MARKLNISSKVLEHLIKFSGYTENELAEKLKLSDHSKIRHFINGQDSPTIAQLNGLADILKRPMAIFFIDEKEIPSEMPMPTDYRTSRKERFSPNVLLAKRKSYYLVQSMKELTDKKSHIPEFEKNISLVKLAHEFRKFLETPIDETKNKPPKNLLNSYKELIERRLFIPVIEYPFKSENIRAFSIHSDICLIALNEDDMAAVKLFSLFHEIYHLLKRGDGICSIDFEHQTQDIETRSNTFSAEFLVPADDLKKEVAKVGGLDEERIHKLSKVYGVSKQVIILRLLNLGYIEYKFYEDYKKRFETQKYVKSKFAKRNWESIYFNRSGGLILKTVLGAYKKGSLSLSETLNVLGIKSKYLNLP